MKSFSFILHPLAPLRVRRSVAFILFFGSLISAQSITVSKDSIRIINENSSSFIDQVTFTSNSSDTIRLDSVFVVIAKMDTIGFGYAISKNGMEVGWRSTAPSGQEFVWTMASAGPDTWRMVKKSFSPTNAQPLLFPANGAISQMAFLEFGVYLFGETMPKYTRYLRGTMRLFFSNAQVVELKLRSNDLRVNYSINPDSLLLRTAFPFDTTIYGLVNVTSNKRVVIKCGTGSIFTDGVCRISPVRIPRYGLSFALYCPNALTVCPLPMWGDFIKGESDTSGIKYPKDQTRLFSAKDCCGGVISCTSWARIDTSTLTHEYRFPAGSSFLYMKVLDGSAPDSIKLRFNTTPFLQADAVLRPNASRLPQHSASRLCEAASAEQGGGTRSTVSFFSVTGKNITTEVMKGSYFQRTGIVVVKIKENGRSYYLKELLAR
jgi:hypothetical protein